MTDGKMSLPVVVSLIHIPSWVLVKRILENGKGIQDLHFCSSFHSVGKNHTTISWVDLAKKSKLCQKLKKITHSNVKSKNINIK